MLLRLSNSDDFVQVDAEDYDKLCSSCWYLNNRRYVIRASKKPPRSLARIIMNAPPHLQVDHINHDLLDNRKSNLRLVTNEQNGANKKPRKENKTNLKGVTSRAGRIGWLVAYTYRGERVNLGTFNNRYDAAKTYNSWAKEVMGEFAYLNDLEPLLEAREKDIKICTILKKGRRFSSLIKRLGEPPEKYKYKGVIPAGKGRFWGASINISGKTKFIGQRQTEIEAARLYDEYVAKNIDEKYHDRIFFNKV